MELKLTSEIKENKMKIINKWNKESIDLLKKMKSGGVSNMEIATTLNRSIKSVGAFCWKFGIKKSTGTTSSKVKVEKVKVQKEKKIKIKITTVKSLIPNPKSENFQDDFELLLYRIRKSIENQNSAYLAGKKIIYIKGNFFKRHSTREYLYFIEKEEKSYFLRTNIFNGSGNFLTDGKNTTKTLLKEWLKNYEENKNYD